MNDADRPVHLNHLIHETSPYLLQHAHNPVDWHPWGPEALARARAEDKPIYLSIGYSACHWCHVMERESFENPAIAAIMNEHFVNIKVDREERPDLDDLYMAAVLAQTGHGGWPMSVWLTPDLKPFHTGTYFPPDDRYGRPGFPRVLLALAQMWREQRGRVAASADALVDYLRGQLAGAPPAGGAPSSALLEGAAAQLAQSYDAEDGGWGMAPKFPNSAAITLLLREHRRTGDAHLLEMSTHTLDCMALGGMYDHVGGGFARYSVDGEWLVPHFEKMLYDNAQLAAAYVEAHQATGRPLYRRVATETLDYLLRDMRDPLGGFHSAEDADSEGEEGKFYLWRAEEIDALLGRDAGARFREHYRIRPEGNFASHEDYHAGLNIPHVDKARAKDPDGDAGMTPALAAARLALLEARAKRVRPGKDDKVLTSWNALAISAFAQAARAFDAPRYRDAAAEAGAFLMARQWRDGTLLRTHRRGESRLPGYLDDYAFTANAFCDLHEATFDEAWIAHARTLADAMIARFWDGEAGNFYFTGAEHADLLLRTKPTYDGAEPSGNSVAALALLRLGTLLDHADYRDRAARCVAAAATPLAKAPQGYLRMALALDWLVHPPVEIAVVGAPDDPATRALLRAVYTAHLPRRIVAGRDSADAATMLPLLRDKTAVGGRPTAYVCRNFVCESPVDDAEALAARL